MSTPFRDTIREKNAVARATDRLTQYEARRATHILSDYDHAVWTGTFAATIGDLLAVIENLQTVADHTEGGTQ
jgi:hypothetical protein